MKYSTNKIMDITGAPAAACFLCMMYVIFLLNYTTSAALNYRTPIEACFGYTPDISPFLQYHFWEPVYFLHVYQDSSKTRFPNTDERFGYWAGPCEFKGDAFTYNIVLPDGSQTLARSILRSAKTGPLNLRAHSYYNADMDSAEPGSILKDQRQPRSEESGSTLQDEGRLGSAL